MRRPLSIRQWLGLLLAAFAAPATLGVAALLAHSYDQERSGMEQAHLEVARALMQAIDRELASAGAALEALATSPSLDPPDQAGLGAFQVQADAVLRGRPGNLLVLCGPDLHQLVNTGRPWGSALPAHGNPEHIRRVFADARPTISNLYTGPTVHRLLTSVDVPVLRDGQVRYVLSMQYLGERLGAILERQQIPAGALASIRDGEARVVWTSRARRVDTGQAASTVLSAGLALGPEGMVDDGDSVVVYSRSAVSDWSVTIALQRSVLNASLWRALAWVVPGMVALLALGLLLVVIVGRRIEAALRALVHPAIALGHGQQVVLPPLPLREAHEVGHALVRAAALMRARTVERDAAARAERVLRDAKHRIEHSEAVLRHALTDKDTLLKELYHRVKNNLQLIISLFNLQAGTLSDAGARRALQEAAARVHAMALVHERLYQSRTPGTIALDDYVGELCEQLAGAACASQRGIDIVRRVAHIDIGLDIAVPLGLLLNELVTNSLKHAFPDKRSGSISVVIEPDPCAGAADDGLRLRVSDDGIGLPPDASRTSTQTLGLRLVGALSEQLHGQLSFGADSGACATLLFRASRTP